MTSGWKRGYGGFAVACSRRCATGETRLPRKKQEPIDSQTARRIGGLLRGLRRTAGYRSVKDAAAREGCPAAQQTIYAYERGGLVPSLKQFMELVEFYALATPSSPDELRYQGVAAMIFALSTPAYHIPEAMELIERLQPAPPAGRRRRGASAGHQASTSPGPGH